MTEHWHSNKTQIYWTCRALSGGRTINHLDEIGEARGWRLGAIIHTLRTRYGWPIFTDYRGPDRIAHYRLSSRCDVLALDYPQSAKALQEELRAAAEAAGAMDGTPAGATGQPHG
ncbi:hypothetical protein P2H44_10750 [Albimonas sp. CAU 1670]|uniref:hypothetical protein n=1 Tax=Albimonas sp. CAU 1670 TaxID=3032599 RepID=UPI0023DC6FB6|nr:hypothetical protein [Albimonas sp. CAU 1670]MDF2233031.1 hypothetical protein [Albimonas sp. CAU 1670]